MTEPFGERAVGEQRLQLRDDAAGNDNTAPAPHRQHRICNHGSQKAEHRCCRLARGPFTGHCGGADFWRAHNLASLQPVNCFQPRSTYEILSRNMAHLTSSRLQQRHFGIAAWRHADMTALAFDWDIAVARWNQR